MGKKMKIPSLFFKNKETRPPWQWPLCKQQPKTLSFRAGGEEGMFKTINSVFFEPSDEVETPDSCFTNSSDSTSLSTDQSEDFGGESLEVIIRGVQSERLFFEPGDTSSILEEAKTSDDFPFKESLLVAVDSDDPYVDFRRSMEEMVESHGLKDWDYLEELLEWYLRVNGDKNHGFIVEAFVDLLVGLSGDSTSSQLAPSGEKEIDEEDKLVTS